MPQKDLLYKFSNLFKRMQAHVPGHFSEIECYEKRNLHKVRFKGFNWWFR